jgi:hypothetical protein
MISTAAATPIIRTRIIEIPLGVEPVLMVTLVGALPGDAFGGLVTPATAPVPGEVPADPCAAPPVVGVAAGPPVGAPGAGEPAVPGVAAPGAAAATVIVAASVASTV